MDFQNITTLEQQQIWDFVTSNYFIRYVYQKLELISFLYAEKNDLRSLSNVCSKLLAWETTTFTDDYSILLAIFEKHKEDISRLLAVVFDDYNERFTYGGFSKFLENFKNDMLCLKSETKISTLYFLEEYILMRLAEILYNFEEKEDYEGEEI